jgi:hypothetical protein
MREELQQSMYSWHSFPRRAAMTRLFLTVAVQTALIPTLPLGPPPNQPGCLVTIADTIDTQTSQQMLFQ